MSNIPAEYIVWIDCEMTGLDIDSDGLTEIAILLTDFDLNVLAEGLDLVINPGQEVLNQMNDFVRNMHKESGLLPLIETGLTVEEAEAQAIAYVKKHANSAGRALVAGNTIGMDRRFISKYMPQLDAVLHYRSIDVSTIKELSRRWYEPAFWAAPEKRGGHRALADIAESIQELAYFRKAVLVEAPGPDKTVARQLANTVTEDFQTLFESTHGATEK
ncbi:MAG: oligoribonuclease [Canibacter sp.]